MDLAGFFVEIRRELGTIGLLVALLAFNKWYERKNKEADMIVIKGLLESIKGINETLKEFAASDVILRERQKEMIGKLDLLNNKLDNNEKTKQD